MARSRAQHSGGRDRCQLGKLSINIFAATLCFLLDGSVGSSGTQHTWDRHLQRSPSDTPGMRGVPQGEVRAAGAGAGAGTGPSESPLYVRWCCVGTAEFDFCKATVPALSEKDSASHWSCVAKSSKEECMDAIAAGEAELVNLDAGLAYRAFIGKRLKAIAAERLDYGEAYDAVAVVHKDFCTVPRAGSGTATPAAGAAAGAGTGAGTGPPAAATPGTGVAGGPTATKGTELWQKLQHKRSCHAFYGSSAGWDFPTLLVQALHPPGDFEAPDSAPSLSGISRDAQLLGSFFSASCAPSTTAGSAPFSESTAPVHKEGAGGADEASQAQQGLSGVEEQLCTGCKSAKGVGSCSLEDPFAGFSGSFRCLMEKAGDVAFTRASVPRLFATGGHLTQPWATQPVSEFKFLCPPPRGGCVDIVDNPAALNCTLGRIPANVIMTRNSIEEADKQRIVARLETAGTVQRWRTVLYEGNNPNDFVLTSSARGLVRLEQLSRAYLGRAGEAAAEVQSFNFKGLGADGNPKKAGRGITRTPLSVQCLLALVFAFLLLQLREQ